MYSNLAERCRNRLLTRETFDTFFRSCGLIGEIIFLKFDASKNGTISFKDFVKAFEIMIKGTVREKADVLFELYDVHKTGGVTYT
jgi:Ca2+-binding EF-hand superfamily protein